MLDCGFDVPRFVVTRSVCMVAERNEARKGLLEKPTTSPQETLFIHNALRAYPRYSHFGGNVKRLFSSVFLIGFGLAVLLLPASAVQAQGLAALPIDGVKCEGMEGAVVHIHQHLQIFDRGRAVSIPSQIGIPAGRGCLYWLHTHSNDGLIHEESPVRRSFTLGQFFDIWGQELSWYAAGPVRAVGGKRLVIQVNGRGYKGKDPRGIVLRNHDEIVIQAGPPWAHTINKIKWGNLG